MFDKLTTFKISRDDIEILDNEMVKTASQFILPEGHEYDPDFLYLRVRAVSAGEYWGPNKNADFFPEEELKQSYKTFLQAHTFKNHENKDIAKAIGDVIEAVWNDKMKYVELLIRIDRKVAPTVVRGFEKGFMTDVSMGCRIKHSICSICGNIAKTRNEYCDHIKLEKHRIYPDGRRVYEINIGPKFHDISAVLNGADKTAKVTGLYIMGDKIAFAGFDESFEKAASFEESLYDPSQNDFTPYFKTAEFHMNYSMDGNGGLSFNSVDVVPGEEIFESRLNKSAKTKKEHMQKIAEIKKVIQGKVIGLANSKMTEKAFENVEDVVKLLKLFYTDYWTEDKCKQIANSIKEIAAKREISPEEAFQHFCHTAELAGIELSSLEFERVVRYLINDKNGADTEMAIKNICDTIPFDSISKVMQDHDNIVDSFSDDIDMPKVIRIRRVVNTSTPEIMSKIKPQGMGLVLKAISRGIEDRPIARPSFIDNDMMEILRNEIPHRSYHKAHLLPRMIKIVKMDKSPNFDNLAHFVLPLLLKMSDLRQLPLAASAYGYSAYQNGRVKLANSAEYEAGLEKFASILTREKTLANELAQFGEVEKVASGYTHGKALLYGLPITYGYSAMQRSRIRNGENVSGFNRYVAENPGNAYLVQALMGPQLLKKIKRTPKDVVNKVDTATSKIKGAINTMKKTAAGDYMSLMSKEASYFEEINNLQFNIDMFNDKIIDEKLAQEYNEQQTTAIKYATILYGLGREDAYNETLNKFALCDNDVNKYLKIAEDYFTMEIEKKANFLWDVGVSTAQDMVFNPIGSSVLALGPGNILDGIAFTKLINKLEKDAEKAQQSSQQPTPNKAEVQKQQNLNIKPNKQSTK